MRHPGHGFTCLRCADCGHDKLVASSCRWRGSCASCGFGLVLNPNPPAVLPSVAALAVMLVLSCANRVVVMPQAVPGVAFPVDLPIAVGAALVGREWTLAPVRVMAARDPISRPVCNPHLQMRRLHRLAYTCRRCHPPAQHRDPSHLPPLPWHVSARTLPRWLWRWGRWWRRNRSGQLWGRRRRPFHLHRPDSDGTVHWRDIAA